MIFIGVAVAVFFTLTNPLYGDISDLRERSLSYDEALGNSKALENARDELTRKKNAIDPNNLLKLEKLLPENIDNIRLILEIEKIALPYGMVLKDIKYSTDSDATKTGTAGIAGGVSRNKEYGIWNLEFSTTGTYNNFLNFTKDLERNLRIVDISSINFSSGGGGANTPGGESYKYDFKIKTYWLKSK